MMAAKTMMNVPVLATTLFFVGVVGANEGNTNWFERETAWHGYRQLHFTIAERSAYVVAPKQPATGKPWVWRARFPDYHAEMDIALLGKGYHIGYVDVAGMFGSPTAIKVGDEFYEYVTTNCGLASKPCLEGVSRGGLFVYNWAAVNPSKVACIYCDTPVLDFKSWPGGQGGGLGAPAAWKQCLQAFGLTEEEAEQFDQNPIDRAEALADSKIPLLHIVSENDRVVPPQENTYLLKRRLEDCGHGMEVISVPKGTAKTNGHHFEHPAPERVVEFVVRHTKAKDSTRLAVLRRARRIVFLGDSITYAGQYVAFFDAWLGTQDLDPPPVVIDVGLPSETVSGLSEDGHAGGRFPRPDLAERLDRVQHVTKPDLVFACYGINCGIYQPFSNERLSRYQSGVRNLKQKVEAAGATLVLVTPPFYDDQRAKKQFSYNAVLGRYSQWLLSQEQDGWLIIDLHGPMTAEVAARRETSPDFTFQPDAVHPNEQGHWFIATQLISWFGGKPAETPQEMLARHEHPPSVLDLTQQRISVRRDAYLTAAGHKRPGIRKGLPVAEAEQKAQELSARMQELLEADR